MQRVLVTGGAGFIGRALTQALLEQSVNVVVVDDLRMTPLQPPLGELRQKPVLAMDRHDLDGVDTIYHLASFKSVPESFDQPLQYLDNVDSVRHLLDLCQESRVGRVVIGSTCEVYGEAATLPTREDAALAPRSPYAASKVALEMITRAHQQAGHSEIVVARLFNVFGPGERPDALVPRVCRSALLDGKIAVEGSGMQRRDLSYIDDTVDRLLVLARARCNAVVNVGSGESWAVAEVVAEVERLAPWARRVAHPARRAEIAEFRADTTLMASLQDRPAPPTAVTTGIRQTFAWWQAREHQIANVRAQAIETHEKVSS